MIVNIPLLDQNTNYFLVNGGWSEFAPITTCSLTCGEGTRTWKRECNSPKPDIGGLQCIGQSSEIRSCIANPCPGTLINIIYDPPWL